MRRLLTLAIVSAAAFAQTVDGDWLGTLALPNGKVRVVFHLKATPSGLSGTMDSPDQGVTGIPVNDASFAGGVLRLGVRAVGGTFEGRLSEDGQTLTGTLSQGNAAMPLSLVRATKAIEGPRRPQEPKPPFPYDSAEVTIDSAEGVKLAGTLTVPKGEGKFPAVVLISGSGPQVRDATMMGHKMFLVLADHLTRKGIAVLRYDDRGFGKSTGNFAAATSADFAVDAAAAAAFLRKHSQIDPARVGLLGHSEGGLIAPMIAAKDPSIAFIVMLAGQGVTGEQVMIEQAGLILKASGATPAMIEQQRSLQQAVFGAVRSEVDPAALKAKVREMTAHLGAAAEAQNRMVESAWFRYFLLHDPAVDLKKVKCPVLAMIGTLDLQVSATQNLPPIEKALREGGNKDFQTISLPGLNHLFQTAKTGVPAEYSTIEETIAPAALTAITDWLLARVK
jgi:pimeloyl-ACP methyl ester carboxylesterase